MTNAKKEFLEEIGSQLSKRNWVKCAQVNGFNLKIDYTPEEYEKFLSNLDYEYDDGYGSQILHGNIWYVDGTWSERCEYDGSEWWEYKSTPGIPGELRFDMESIEKQIIENVLRPSQVKGFKEIQKHRKTDLISLFAEDGMDYKKFIEEAELMLSYSNNHDTEDATEALVTVLRSIAFEYDIATEVFKYELLKNGKHKRVIEYYENDY